MVERTEWQLVDGAVTRVDDLVLRPAYPWTETVHSLLRHLRDAGLDCVPDPVGVRDGVEAVRWIPGDSGVDAWPHQRSTAGVRSAAALLRRIHEATVGFEPDDDAEWAFPPTSGATDLSHGDPGPWNFVWRDGKAVALVDWDYASPAPAMTDVAYALETFAPFRADDEIERTGRFDAPPDRGERLLAFAEAYGLPEDSDLVTEVIDRQGMTIRRISDLAERGWQPWASWVQAGYLDQLRSRVRWSRSHRDLIDRGPRSGVSADAP